MLEARVAAPCFGLACAPTAYCLQPRSGHAGFIDIARDLLQAATAIVMAAVADGPSLVASADGRLRPDLIVTRPIGAGLQRTQRRSVGCGRAK